jgi:hypothetical protein
MGRLGTLLLGIVLGASGMYTGIKYHVVRANDGVHLVPKMSSEFTDVFVDIRKFTVSDWNDHRALAAALVNSDKPYLLEDAAVGTLRHSVDAMLDVFGRRGRG